MKILIDIGHPAHVHYCRNAVKIWEEKGHTVIITSRNKEVIVKLLKFYELEYIDRGKGKNTKLGKLLYMLQADIKLLKIALKHKPDIFLSFSSSYAAQVAYFLRKPHIAFNDTEHTDKIHSYFTYPFSSAIITPNCYQNDLGKKQVRFYNIDDGLYLHDNYFEPKVDIKKDLNLTDDEEFVLLRFVSWNAHHDFGQSGLDLKTKQDLVKLLEKKYKVLISSEEDLPSELKAYEINVLPEHMHSVLKEASLFVGESGTMASESAYLGTFSVYINSLPLMGYLEMEQEAGLLKHFNSSQGVLEYVEGLINTQNLNEDSNNKAERLKENFIDPTKFLVWFIENYPKSLETIRQDLDYQLVFK